MKFTDILKNEKSNSKPLADVLKDVQEEKLLLEAKKKEPEELLRGAKFKIKMVTPTSFGTQIDFAKLYPKEDIEKVLDGFDIKIKNKSVFIID